MRRAWVAHALRRAEVISDELVFFNESEARTVDAVAARIIPGDDADPGAREAGAVVYIDRALAGAYGDFEKLYRRGLWELDHYCRTKHGGPFAELDEEHQDEVLSHIDAATESQLPTQLQIGAGERQAVDLGPGVLAEFFAAVRQHTIEGTFCDPAYGGNRDAVGWRLLGFPGAQWGYSAEQMRLGFDATTIPVKALKELRRERRSDGDR
jgi:gluconate 2-dehydrogenase gamma chain